MIKRYNSAYSFRQALEKRLKSLSSQKRLPLIRLRKQIAFDRFLARLFNNKDPQWLLKGGYALELRFSKLARTTRDLDFTIPYLKNVSKEKIRQMVQEEVERDLGDWFIFYIGTPQKTVDLAIYGGWRFSVEARLDNMTFEKFSIDICVGEPSECEYEWKETEDLLHFAHVLPARVAVVLLSMQFAEKIHAYTYPRKQAINSRTRDLVDLVLLIERGLLDIKAVKRDLDLTFKRRNTHAIPHSLSIPPDNWKNSYKILAEACGISKKGFIEAFKYVEDYWEAIMKSKQ